MTVLNESYTLSNGVAIAGEDMEALKNLPRIEDYGEARNMPVFGVSRRELERDGGPR